MYKSTPEIRSTGCCLESQLWRVWVSPGNGLEEFKRLAEGRDRLRWFCTKVELTGGHQSVRLVQGSRVGIVLRHFHKC